MRGLVILAMALGLSACASGPQSSGGFANYDDLRRATDTCAAKGGRLVLARNGDAQMLGDYECRKTEVSAQ